MSPSYKGHRYPVEVISYCVWLYFRERLLATAVADATRDDASAHISTRVIRGAPDEVLLAVAHGASTLVVGHRSQKSLTHSILSGPSVSRRCTKKADCRVVVVRESTP